MGAGAVGVGVAATDAFVSVTGEEGVGVGVTGTVGVGVGGVAAVAGIAGVGVVTGVATVLTFCLVSGVATSVLTLGFIVVATDWGAVGGVAIAGPREFG